MAYTNLINKYGISRDTIVEAINVLAREVWKIDGDAVDILAITDFLVNGDLTNTVHTNIKNKYNIPTKELVMYIDQICEYVWRSTDSATVQLAIIDMLVQGDIIETTPSPEPVDPYINAPTVNIVGENISYNSVSNIDIDGYTVKCNGNIIYDGVNKSFNLKDAINEYNSENVNKIESGTVTVEVYAYNSTEYVTSATTTVYYIYESGSYYLNKPTITISNGIMNVIGGNGNVPAEEYQVYYGDDGVAYFTNIGVGKPIADIVPSFGTYTFRAVAFNYTYGVQSVSSDEVTYSYIPELAPTTCALVGSGLRVFRVENAESYEIRINGSVYESIGQFSGNYYTLNLGDLALVGYEGVITLDVVVGYLYDGSYHYSVPSNSVQYEVPSQSEPVTVNMTGTSIDRTSVDIPTIYVYIDKEPQYDSESETFVNYDYVVEGASSDSDFPPDPTHLEFTMNYKAYVCCLPYINASVTAANNAVNIQYTSGLDPMIAKITYNGNTVANITVTADYY